MHTLTASASPTPVPATPTRSPTVTASVTASPTVSPSPRPLPTLTPTLTALPPPPVYAETPSLTFTRDTFLQYLGFVRDSFRSAYRNYARIDRPGGCSTYHGWLALWVKEAPVFTEVPPAWGSLHYEYRSWIQQAVSATWKHHLLCSDQAEGILTEEEVAAMADFSNGAWARMETLVAEAQQNP